MINSDAKDKAHKIINDCDSYLLIATTDTGENHNVNHICSIQTFDQFKIIYETLRVWCTDTLENLRKKMLEE